MKAARMLHCAVLAALLISCAETETTVTGYDHGRPIGTHRTRTFLYGKLSDESLLFLERMTSNMDIGFGKLATMFSTMVSAYIAGDVLKAQEATKQLASAGATQVQITSIKTAAQTEALRIKTQGGVTTGAINAGASINPISVNSP